MDPHVVDSTMGLQRLYLVHQPAGCCSVHDLVQHSVVAAVVGVGYVGEVHPPGAFQINWVVESVAPEEKVALVSAPALVLAEAHPPDVVHPRIHSPLAIRPGHKAAARRMDCSTSCSSPSAASCNASLPVDWGAAVLLHLPILLLVDLEFHLDRR